MEDWHLDFDEWYKKHIKPYKIQALQHQENTLCHGYPECTPLWTSDEAFGNVFGSQHISTCMPCSFDITLDSDTCKYMVASSTPMETVKQDKLYFDTCASHMSTPIKEDSVTLNEDHTAVNIDRIASGITILGNVTVKYIMLDDNGKPYTMMVEEYWVP